MYGASTLPNTGAVGLTVLGVSVGNEFWLMLALITLAGMLFAIGNIIPRKEV